MILQQCLTAWFSLSPWFWPTLFTPPTSASPSSLWIAHALPHVPFFLFITLFLIPQLLNSSLVPLNKSCPPGWSSSPCIITFIINFKNSGYPLRDNFLADVLHTVYSHIAALYRTGIISLYLITRKVRLGKIRPWFLWLHVYSLTTARITPILERFLKYWIFKIIEFSGHILELLILALLGSHQEIPTMNQAWEPIYCTCCH